MIEIKSPAEISLMREAGRLVAVILQELEKEAVPGVTSKYLNDLAERRCRENGVKPAFKGYGGYPYSVCCSLNSQVVHGFPSDKPLKEGDILSMDFGVIYKGFYGDSAITVGIGAVSEEARKLMEATKASLDAGIARMRPGNHLGDVSHAVQKTAEGAGFSVVRQFVGHGIGRNLHEDPQLPNFGPSGRGVKLKPGMVIAIEPMINAGTWEVRVLEDGWTAVTLDDRISAHFEHTVAITDDEPYILSLP